MPEAQNNEPMLHRKEWQTMMPPNLANATLMFMANGNAAQARYSMYVTAATVHYLYDNDNDSWLPIASGAFSPAIAAGACGTYHRWSPAYTANGGSTTTVTVNTATHNLNNLVVGETIEFLTGTAANIGLRRTITGILTCGGTSGNIVLTLDSPVDTVVNTDTFRISSGSFFIFTSGALATSFKRFDLATMSWSSALSITNLPATWGTDGRMVTPCIVDADYDSGTAAASSSTTQLDCTGKTWTPDQWINYQVRITGGTGCGQIRKITDNDADSLTFATGIDLDETSTFVIEGDEDAIYLLGNNAVTMYKYSISGNSWAVMAPTTARAGAPVAGMQANFIGQTGDADWANVSDIKDGRYIYSFRGATGVLDRFNISGGTAGAGAWEVVTYQPNLTTFATGASSDWDGGLYVYVVKEGTAAIPQRIYKYNLIGNRMVAVTEDWYLGGAATLGNKAWVASLSTTGLVKWLYVLGATAQTLRRIMLY
jgi:hypothetical protein